MLAFAATQSLDSPGFRRGGKRRNDASGGAIKKRKRRKFADGFKRQGVTPSEGLSMRYVHCAIFLIPIIALASCDRNLESAESAGAVASLLEPASAPGIAAAPVPHPTATFGGSAGVIYGMVKLGIERRPLGDSSVDSVTIRIQGKDDDGHRIVNAIHIDYADLEALAAGEPVVPLRRAPSSPAPLGIVDAGRDTKGMSVFEASRWRWPTSVQLSQSADGTHLLTIELGPELDRRSGAPLLDSTESELIAGGTIKVECRDDVAGLVDPMFRNTTFCKRVLADAPSLRDVALSLQML